MRILFLHGWRSIPGGVRPTFLAQHGHEVINPKLPDEDFPEAVKRLKERAEKTYALIGAKYTEGAKSPVEGAIRRPAAKTKQPTQ